VRIAQCIEPDKGRAALYAELFESYCGLYPALRATNSRLHDFC
jgi:hypothetical protein